MVGRDGGVMLLCTAREGQSHLEVFCCLRDLRLFLFQNQGTKREAGTQQLFSRKCGLS